MTDMGVLLLMLLFGTGSILKPRTSFIKVVGTMLLFLLGYIHKSRTPQVHKTTTHRRNTTQARTSWCSDCRVFLDSAAHTWVPAGHPRYTRAHFGEEAVRGSPSQYNVMPHHNMEAEPLVAHITARARPTLQRARSSRLLDCLSETYHDRHDSKHESNVNSDRNASCCYVQGDQNLDFFVAKDRRKRNSE